MGRHKSKDKRFCYSCGTDKTSLNKSGCCVWFLNKPTDLFLCLKCYYKYIGNFIGTPIYSNRMITFKGRSKRLKSNPRKGICYLCHRKIGDKYTTKKGEIKVIKRMAIHHLEYHDDDVLKDTVELCQPCHNKETWRLGQFDNKNRDSKGRFTKRNC